MCGKLVFCPLKHLKNWIIGQVSKYLVPMLYEEESKFIEVGVNNA
jgi:hypothetical protein